MATGHIEAAARGSGQTYRTTAIVVGILYLAGFVAGLSGEGLMQSVLGAPNHLATVSASRMVIAAGALLWLAAVVGDAAHGVLMFPVLRQYSERIAIGYLAARVIDAAFIALMVLFLLLQIPLGSEYLKADANAAALQTLSTVSVQASQYAYQIAMSTLAISGILLCYGLHRARLVPRIVSLWGLVGYTVILCGMLSEIMGSGLGLASSIPGGLWEVFMGGWLIARGFSPLAILPTSGAATR